MRNSPYVRLNIGYGAADVKTERGDSCRTVGGHSSIAEGNGQILRFKDKGEEGEVLIITIIWS